MTPGERLRQSLRKQTQNEVARRGPDGKKIPKKSLQGLLPGRETPDFFFLTAHEHDESWRCVHVASTSAKSATTVDSRTRVRVKS